MPSSRKALKLCLILTDIFIGLLIIITVFLPYGISWYVETMHRSQSLPATVMVTCYPCAPFVGIALFMLRRILKRASNGAFFTDIGLNDIRVISVCCAVIAVITLIAGRYYLPFYIVGGTFAFWRCFPFRHIRFYPRQSRAANQIKVDFIKPICYNTSVFI